MNTDEIIDFLTEAGKLKKIPRTGWVELGVQEPESVADHSFRVALIALILADVRGLDSLKVARMALLHDLAEAETGDLTPVQRRVNSVVTKRGEEEAMNRLLMKLPQDIRGIYKSAWHEFSGASTQEALLLRDADKLEMLIQAFEYQLEGYDRSKLMRFWHAEINGDDAKAIREAVRSRSIRAEY